MTTESFPTNPANRRVIVVLQKQVLDRCAYEKDAGRILVDEETYVLAYPVPESSSQDPVLQSIVRGGRARPNMVLIQSPFDPTVYVEASEASEQFALAKHFYFSAVCSLLGAKEVVVEQIECRQRSESQSLVVTIGNPSTNSGEAKGKSDAFEKFRTNISLHDEFEGGAPNPEAARSLMNRAGLANDLNIQGLYEMRAGGTNTLKSRKFIINLSSEAQSNLEVAARVHSLIPSFLVEMKAKYAKIVKDLREYNLTVKVKF